MPTVSQGTQISEQLRLRLALAMAKPGSRAMLIDENNEEAGWCSLEDAVDSGGAYATDPPEEILVWDQDELHLWRSTTGAPGPLMMFTRELRGYGLLPVVQESGRPGHHHFVVRVDDRELRAKVTQLAKSRGMKPRTGRIRPILAPHRLGLPVKLVTPHDPEDAIKFLTPTRRSGRGVLPKHIQTLLTHGDLSESYPHRDGGSDRSRMMNAIILSAIQHDFDKEVLFYLLRDRNNAGGARLQCTRGGEEISEVDAREDFAKSWTSAERWIRDNPAQADQTRSITNNSEIKRIEDAARANIRGRTSATDLNVILAFVEKAYEVHSLRVGFSIRDLAEKTGISSHRTVKASQRRLRAAGWLKLFKTGRGDKASIYDLQLPSIVPSRPHSDVQGGVRGKNGLPLTQAH